MAEPESPRSASIWIKIFVVLHLVCITMWSLPYPKRPYMNNKASFGINTSNLGSFVKSFSETVTEGTLYLNWRYLKGSPLMYYPGVTGFWQYWDMFSPNPASVDLYLEADVTFKNGTVTRFKFPRVYTLPIHMKYFKERYRKFYENANSDDQMAARPYLAQRIALENFKDPDNPPEKVMLIRHFDTIEPPGTPPDPTYTVVPFFEYQVDQVKLRHDKGIAP